MRRRLISFLIIGGAVAVGALVGRKTAVQHVIVGGSYGLGCTAHPIGFDPWMRTSDGKLRLACGASETQHGIQFDCLCTGELNPARIQVDGGVQ